MIVPAIEKVYIVNNGCADTITVKNASGTGVAVPAGKTMYVYNNGTNVLDAINHLTSLTLTSALPVSSGGTGITSLGSGVATFLGTPSSTNLAAAVTDETGSGALVFANSPTFTGTPIAPTAANGTNTTQIATTAFVQSLIPSGTVMFFGQTTAPTGFTKDTTNFNNSALRVVTGTVSSGGSVDFTTAFTSQTPSGSINTSGLSAAATTLTTSQIPAHGHAFAATGAPGGSNSSNGGITLDSAAGGRVLIPENTGAPGYTGNQIGGTGGGGSHTHSVSGTATFTGSPINLAVRYVDVIRATKD